MADDQRETIAFLAEGASYGQSGAPVERIDTHCSILFLVGARTYKLKRAVAFTYLDYTTLAAREAACRAELALNRRTAPALYLGIHAVTRAADGRLALDGDGPVADWLVAMRRFDQEALFDRMAERRQLTPALMRDLADAVADFHGRIEPDAAEGGRAGIARIIESNHLSLRAAGAAFDQRAVEALHDASSAALAQAAALLERRRETGRVRLCHGDLHLGNICLVEGRPTPFDGIEFSAAFATIDVLYDIAFLLMDLWHRGLPDLGSLVFNRYVDRTGDAQGLPALPLFLSVRAAIRAHVSAAAKERQTDAAAAERLARQGESYLRFARALLAPAQPRLIALGGRSGTGKSTVARGLAAGFAPPPGARIIRTDTLRKRLLGVPPETRLPPHTYDRATSDRVYEALYAEAAATLAAGYAVIADATFLRESERAAIAAVAEAAKVPFSGFWLEAPAEVLAGRVQARRGDASDADAAVLRAQLAMDIGTPGWPRIDAGGPPEAVQAAVRTALAIPA
jgi:aminoglycoside phosphotransferase family enzyme/predicted kinase